MGFGDGFNKQYPGLENSGSTDIKVTGSLLVTGDLTVLGSSNIGGGGGGGDALTGSTNIFRADQIISGNLDIDGTITAKQFNVVTSSVLYESGSTKFGDDPTDTHQFTGSVISSVGFTGSLNGTASYATNATSALTASYVTTSSIHQFTDGVRNQFSAGNNVGISSGVISLSSSLEGLTAVSASYFTGSFIGDGSQLTGISGLVNTNQVVYVNAGYAGTSENGSFLAPYKTIQAAHDYASSSYSNFSTPVLIDIAPGTYVEDLTITRHNTYFRSSTSKYEQRSVKISGQTIIDCLTAAQKYSEIVGFEGVFFEKGGAAVATVEVKGTGKHLTYFKDCYLYNTNGGTGASCLKTTNTNAFNDNKIVIQNCYFKGEGASGWDGKLLELAGGDIKIDGTEISTSGVGGNGYGIYITGDTVVTSDRILVDIDVDKYAIYNDSTASGILPKLVLSNASVRTTYSVPQGTIYSSNVLLLSNVLLGGTAPKIVGNYSTPNLLAVVTYANLTSLNPLNVAILFTNIAQNVLIETHGTVIASALSGNLSSSYIQGVIPVDKGGTGAANFNGNSLLIASGTSAFTSLTGSSAADKYVVAWDATGSNYVLTASVGGLNIVPSAEGQTLISSGSTFVAARISSSNNIGITYDSGSTTVALNNDITLQNITLTGKITAVSASFQVIENVSASSLQIGDKYIMMVSGASDHLQVDGAGILWGSGSTDATVYTDYSSSAAILYVSQSDTLAVYPRLSGSFTGSFSGTATNALTASFLNKLNQTVDIVGSLTASNHVSASDFYGNGSNLTGIVASQFNGTVLVNSGGTGISSVPSGALLVGSSSTQLSTLSGSAATVGQVAAWTANGFALQVTGSGLPSGGSDGHVLIKSGSGYKWVAIEPSSSVVNKPFTFLHSAEGISLSQSSAISINSGGLGQITQTTGALYVLDTAASRFVPIVGTTNQFLAWDGAKWAATNGFSRQVYTSATPVLATTQVVALSGGLVAASATDRLRANGFGVIQNSSSAGYVVQTSGEALVAFSSSYRNLLVTGSEFYVSSSGTASLYEDIAGTTSGLYATQIGYLNRISGSSHFIIISPRPFGFVY
jgi:hypothetical protein